MLGDTSLASFRRVTGRGVEAKLWGGGHGGGRGWRQLGRAVAGQELESISGAPDGSMTSAEPDFLSITVCEDPYAICAVERDVLMRVQAFYPKPGILLGHPVPGDLHCPRHGI